MSVNLFGETYRIHRCKHLFYRSPEGTKPIAYQLDVKARVLHITPALDLASFVAGTRLSARGVPFLGAVNQGDVAEPEPL